MIILNQFIRIKKQLLYLVILGLISQVLSGCIDQTKSANAIQIDLSENNWSAFSGSPFENDLIGPDIDSGITKNNLASKKNLKTPIVPENIPGMSDSGKLQHLTIRTTFDTDLNTRNSFINPVFSFSGIGDNWAIYLNGHLLKKEIYIQNNQINYSRYFIHAVVPFRASLLKQKNELLIHLIGYGPAKYAFQNYFFGLRFPKNHVLSEAQTLQQEQIQYPKLILYSVFLFFGLYHGLLYLYRIKDRYNLYFSVFLISMSVYFFARTNYASSLFLDQKYLLGTIFTVQIIALSLFIAFLRSYFQLTRKHSLLIILTHCANLLMVILMLVLSYRYYRSLLVIWYAIALPQFVYVLIYIFRATRRGHSDARWMLIAIAIATCMIFWDMADTVFFHTNFRVLQFAILSLILALVAILARRFVRLNDQAKKLNDELLTQKESFFRFVPTRFLSLLKRDSITEVKLGDHMEEDMTVLFSDIRNFTQLSDSMVPDDVFRFINSYLIRMEPSIHRFNGFIDKFIGDGIMALFHGDPDDALRAATEMQKTLIEYNHERILFKLMPIQIGIGINSGEIMLGTVGGTSRMDTTAIGSPVNLASRVEEITKQYHLPILLTEFTVSKLKKPDEFYLRVVDRVEVRGINKPVLLYECFNSDSPELRDRKVATSEFILKGMLDLAEGNIKEAREAFYAIQRILPEDPVAVLFLERCEKASIKLHEASKQFRISEKMVLVVDDNPAILDLVNRFLESRNYKIVTASSGTEAIDKFEELQPDISLVDYMLPDFDGVTLIGKMHQAQKDWPDKSRIYLFTAEDSLETRQRAKNAGIEGFIAKPVRKNDLLGAIGEKNFIPTI